MLFADLKLSPLILRALEIEGYEVATPIQAQAIPHILAGKDVLGSAQTGTGKTAAFALPILNKLAEKAASPTDGRRRPAALVLCPTRELAAQIGAGFKAYGREVKARYSVIFGGVSQGIQVDSLRSGIDVIIATPGRLLDLMNQGHVDLSYIQTLVLDEADRMLDMGFIHDIKRIVAKLPTKRQTLMFSATMPHEIKRLADAMLKHPVTVAVAPIAQVADRIDERVYFVNKSTKPQLLAHLVKDLPMHRAIVFTRTKHGADRVVRKLSAHGIESAAIHGNKSQNNRSRALHQFKSDKIGVLVATDIAARGIDIDDVTHVVNYDLTHEPETYVHRIGRTARAGASGNAISFCDTDERDNLRAIERLIKRKIAITETPVDDLPAAVADPREAHRGRERDEERPSRDRSAGGRGVRTGGGYGGGSGGERHSSGHAAAPRRHESRPTEARHSEPRSHESRPSHGERRPSSGSSRSHSTGAQSRESSPAGRPSRPSHAPTGRGGHSKPAYAKSGPAKSGPARSGHSTGGHSAGGHAKSSHSRSTDVAHPREFPSSGPARHPLHKAAGHRTGGHTGGPAKKFTKPSKGGRFR